MITSIISDLSPCKLTAHNDLGGHLHHLSELESTNWLKIEAKRVHFDEFEERAAPSTLFSTRATTFPR
jgi:hypothetical protein